MNINEWLTHTTNNDSTYTIAQKTGINTATLYRQIPNKLTPETVVKIARAYNTPAIQGLIALGLLTAEDLCDLTSHNALLDAKDSDLTDEILRRLNHTKTTVHNLDTTSHNFDPTKLTNEEREQLARQRLKNGVTLAANVDPHMQDEINHGGDRY